jgi:hypothetical protein
MNACETCGNEYEHPMEITIGGHTHTFESPVSTVAAA